MCHYLCGSVCGSACGSVFGTMCVALAEIEDKILAGGTQECPTSTHHLNTALPSPLPPPLPLPLPPPFPPPLPGLPSTL